MCGRRCGGGIFISARKPIKVRRSHLFLSEFGTFRISSSPAVDPGWLDPSTLCTGCNWTRSKTLSQTWLAGLAGYTGPSAARPHHSRFDSTLLRRACSQAQALFGLATMSPVDDVHRWLFETHPRAGVAVRPTATAASRRHENRKLTAPCSEPQLMYGSLNAIGDTCAQVFFVRCLDPKEEGASSLRMNRPDSCFPFAV